MSSGLHAIDRTTEGIADDLIKKEIPFVFATGYGAKEIPLRFSGVLRWEEPYDLGRVVRDLMKILAIPVEEK